MNYSFLTVLNLYLLITIERTATIFFPSGNIVETIFRIEEKTREKDHLSNPFNPLSLF